MDTDQQLRNLRDFLLVYNRMTETCFLRCSSNFNYRNLTMDEEKCVDSCAGKLIRTNHRLMGTYVQLMPRMVQRRMEEMESKAAESAKAEEAAASAHVEPPAAEASAASQTPVSFSQPPPVAPLSDHPFTPMAIDDAGPEAHCSVFTPVGLSIPVELDAAMSNATTVSEVKLSAATPLTPVIETANFSVLNEAGPSYTGGFPMPPIAGAHIESEISAPVFTPSKPDVPVSSVAAPTVSQSMESLSGQQTAPEVTPPSGQ